MLQRKLREYSTLPALERESRLRAVESHYYLKHLLLAPSDVRSNWLAQVPQEYRRAFEDRLRLWSVLPPELQRFLLQQEATLNSVTRLQGATLAERQEILKQLPPGDRLAVEREAARWESLTPLQRDSAWNGVRQMFELSPRDLQRVIAQAALTNRPRAEHLAATLAPLSRSAKQQYAEGLRKYSALDPVQRVRFNQGWERWKGMSESERALWRQVAHHLPPTPAPPVPPLPPLPGTKAPTGVKTGALPPPDRNGNGNGYADSDAARWAAR
ncbi:MAG TPA: hypothetical protein DCM86_17775 [Verrucomicrobiales bacterium]|nr:hypothetical protein [Verrucomicrobiales bacterium]